MNEAYFTNIANIGNLYLDYVIYEFELEPILFTCVDANKNLYLCLCSDIRYGQKWIITKCNISILEALFFNRIDIASAFCMFTDLTVVEMDINGIEKNYKINCKEIDRLDLPKEGTCVKGDIEKFKNYLWNKKYTCICLALTEFAQTTEMTKEVMKSYIVNIKENTSLFANKINKYSCHFTEEKIVKTEIKKTDYTNMQYNLYTDENYNSISKNISNEILDKNFLYAA